MRFHSDNSNLRVYAPAYGVDAQFVNGYYETNSKAEIAFLSKRSEVKEDKAPKKYTAPVAEDGPEEVRSPRDWDF